MSKLSFLDNGSRDYVEVWVNLPQRLSQARLALLQDSLAIAKMDLGDERDKRVEKLEVATRQFHAEWWDVPVEQLNAIYEVDTSLYAWILNRAAQARNDYEDERKKVVSGS
jgi:hypothetical protein